MTQRITGKTSVARVANRMVEDLREDFSEWQRMLVLHEQHRRESAVAVARVELLLNSIEQRLTALEARCDDSRLKELAATGDDTSPDK